MNKSALEAITTPTPNERQRFILRVAHELHHAHPTLAHANRDDGWASLVREAIDNEKIVVQRPSDKALTLLVNDILDVWDFLIGGAE